MKNRHGIIYWYGSSRRLGSSDANAVHMHTWDTKKQHPSPVASLGPILFVWRFSG